MEIVARQEDESPKQYSYRTAQFKLTTVCPKGLNHKEQEYPVSLMLFLTSFFSLCLKFTHSFCSIQIYYLPMSQRAGIVWTGARGRHHNWGMTPPWKADTVSVHSLWCNTARLQSWLNVGYQPHSWLHLTSQPWFFPLPHFCSLFQPCIICPQNHILLFPMSTLYMGELTLVGWVSQGSWASWLPAQSRQWEVAAGDRRWEQGQSWGISALLFLPWATSPPLTSAPTR